MIFLKKNIIQQTYSQLKKKLSAKSWKKVRLLLPISLFSNIIEILGVFLLYPIIQLILKPDLITDDSIFKTFFNSFGISNHEDAILFSFIFLFIFFVLKNGISYIVIKKITTLQYSIATELVLESFDKHLNESHSFYSKNNIAVILRNIRQIPYEFVAFVLLPFINIINECIVLLIALGIIFLYSPVLFISILLFAVPTLLIYSNFFKKKLNRISSKKDKFGSDQYRIALQALESFVEIKVFQSRGFFIPKFTRTSLEFENALKESTILNTFSPKVTETVTIGSILLIVLAGRFFQIETSELANFLILFAVGSFRILPSLNKITLSLNYIKGNKHVVKHLPDVIEKKMASFSEDEKMNFTSAISFRDLTFCYQSEGKVFENMNFEIQKGSKIGIIGESGAGKTTFLALLLRFYKENSGGVFVDDIKLTSQNINSWYKLISYVPQSVKIIDGNLAQNIAFGIPEKNIDYDRIIDIVQKVHLHDFVEKLPKGIYSTFGENNSDISGGQKQRIGLARALYHGGELLILDEATSALDVDTEKSIMTEINNLESYTVIFVTHRTGALKGFDSIYAMENGKLRIQ
tara:strand:+ start:26794 stop:28530 length:1737 start_codon:yes stop_codon:yes gene_type:complete